jgi:hypothetical protein
MSICPTPEKMSAYDDTHAVNSKRESASRRTSDNESSHVQIGEGTLLNQSFNIWSALGLQYSLTSTPLAIGSYLTSVIGVGGSPVFIFGYLFAIACNMCVCVSLAEIAAVYPHTSGT